jgi:hypothetical protein
MGNKFQTKRTSVSGRLPNTTNSSNTSYIDTGEIAINIPDGKAFSSNGSVLFEIGANLTNLAVANNITANTLTLNANGYIKFNATTAKPTFSEGLLYYDNEEHTIVLYGDGTEFEINVGQREWIRCRNSTGSTIVKGKPVYVTGVHIPGDPVHGHHPTIALADASDETKKNVIGLTGEDIANGTFGYVVVRGYIDGINTSALTSGNRVHLGFASPGDLVSSAPEYPNWPMDVGICLTSNSTVGTLYVNIFDHSFERIRVAESAYIGGDLTVGGSLNVTGNVLSTSVNNLNVSDNLIYLGTGDAITSPTFTGSGLNDAAFKGYFEGLSTTHYYVKIDGVGGTDTFAWSKDNFATTIASGISITGLNQALDNNISIKFNATTGHTLNDKWDGVASPVNVDLGWVGNYNTGALYAHTGIFRDATDGVYKFFAGYTPEPDAAINIDTGHASFALANVSANTFFGNLIGTANNANNLNGQSASYYTNATNISTGTLDTARLPATANITTLINVGANVSINTTAFFVGNVTVNSILTSSSLTVGPFSVNSTSVKITSNDFLTFNDSTTQNTAFRVYDSTGTRIA